ncbi:MAG: Xylose isomerase [Chlamydiia bacterium]|nr:Xylose isomerase [Chlamydiia bacterium]MCH9616034.1 Xylose isomerase [Chlamydiia bacterium]MCH9629057.1 Xylose isomerase [Chlamydiia bacterium]
MSFFKDVPAPVYKYYDPKKQVLGKSMEDHLRFSVAFWHTLCFEGRDVFGNETMTRPWKTPEEKMEAGFEFIQKLGLNFFAFHDADVAPVSTDVIENLIEKTGIELLWGTANLFSDRRFMSGASTNPNPEVFACAAAQVKDAIDTTMRLGGHNYVLWGGREGYDTLLNTDLKQETDHFARFLTLLADYKHKIGFKGLLLIEPKPCEPTKHQYDYDTATVHAFLQKHGLEKEYKVNIEGNHATLAGHTLSHEVAYAYAHDLFGSIDANQGDPLLGWDTDEFPLDVKEYTHVLYLMLLNGGFTSGGFNFDAKIKRQSIDLEDLVEAHASGIDAVAKALLNAAELIEKGALETMVKERYKKWHTGLGKQILTEMSFEEIAAHAREQNLDPKPISGHQERYERLLT